MKKFLMASLAAVLLCSMAGCNRQIIDTTYSFDTAIISLPDGNVIEGKVNSWRDYDGDQIQVTVDGTTYLTHTSCVVLIKEGR